MTDIASQATTTRVGKRKRAQVSYYAADIEQDMSNESQAGFAEVLEADLNAEAAFDEYAPNQRLKNKLDTATRKRAKLNNAKLSAKKKEKKQKPFPFMSLPPDLRDIIYDLALKDDTGITLVSKTKAYRRTVIRVRMPSNGDCSDYGTHRRCHDYLMQNACQEGSSQEDKVVPNKLIPNLLTASKTIRSEASAILYGQPIVLEDTMALHFFLAQIGQEHCRLLKDITIDTWGSGRGANKTMNYASLTLLAGATNLRCLRLDCTIECKNPARLARRIFRDGHYFLEAFATVNGKEAAVEVLDLSNASFIVGRNNELQNYAQREESRKTFKNELLKLMK